MFAALLEMPAFPAWTGFDPRRDDVARLGGYFASPLDG